MYKAPYGHNFRGTGWWTGLGRPKV